jgi:hypothetical protein
VQVTALRSPERVWSRREVLIKPSPVPDAAGVYAWFLRELPRSVPDAGCVRCNGLTLLYVGIALRPPAENGRVSSRTLRTRLRQHYALNAAGSTLRLTLGCLLSQQLGIELRRVGSGKRMTFGAGERILSDWMDRNALVCWLEHPTPWEIEPILIRELRPPLISLRTRTTPFARSFRNFAKWLGLTHAHWTFSRTGSPCSCRT